MKDLSRIVKYPFTDPLVLKSVCYLVYRVLKGFMEAPESYFEVDFDENSSEDSAELRGLGGDKDDDSRWKDNKWNREKDLLVEMNYCVTLLPYMGLQSDNSGKNKFKELLK